jgi:hypothetical protein
MNPDLAAGIIRFVIAKQLVRNAKEKHNKFVRVMSGQTMQTFSKKRVFLSRDNAGIAPASGDKPESFVTWFVLTNKPTTSKDILIKEGAGVALALVSGGVGAAAGGGMMGTQVQQISEVAGMASDVHGAGGVAMMLSPKHRASYSNAMYNKLNSAWRAGMWSAFGDNNLVNFSLAIDEMLIGGVASFSGGIDDCTISMNLWNNKRDLISFMSTAELKGRDSDAARKYMRDIANQISWHYSAKTQSLTQL